MITRHLRIAGRVQGVWYRESLRQMAEELGVSGWVRNRGDGSVEAVLHGEPAAVDSLVAWAWQGPPAAAVTHIDVSEATGSFHGFEKLPSL
jgi:acylphosphatase